MSNSRTYTLKPGHKVVKDYYAELASYADQNVDHEMAIRSAFQNLLSTTAKKHKWTLIPELSDISGGKLTRPDGTIRDKNYLPRGYWEAKDTHDNIEKAISQKIKSGYPTTNIIFENSQTGVLYQNGMEVFRADLTDQKQLTALLNLFYGHVEPAHENFDKAVADFKEKVPELATGLNLKIKEAHKSNKTFQKAYDKFYKLCQESLNPNLRRDAVDEMIIQHLLIERLIRRIFENPDFIQRNIIAAEMENVITALTSHSFSRDEYLKGLDRFYVAIEAAAFSVNDFTERLVILNTVYEQFFQGYSVEVADTHGIVYTPQPIVDFMCASVVEALDKEFGKKLGDPDVVVLDPCTGTGSFVVNLLDRVSGAHLEEFYRKRLFANEVMLMPYYIASLNIEHKYYDRTGNYEPFEGICFVDTLDLVKGKQAEMFVTESNTERIDRQRKSKITLIIGNPPYNAGQKSENDNNKNRSYDNKNNENVVDQRIRATYSKDSLATLNRYLYEPYVRFFRWATDRLQGRDGIVCFVSNNSFVNKRAFDGMRKHLLKDFTRVYHFDLHGDVKQNPKISGTTHNVFAVQVGIGITVAVKSNKHQKNTLYYHRVPEFWRKEEKLNWLTENGSYQNACLREIIPDIQNCWVHASNSELFDKLIPLGDTNTKIPKPREGAFNLFALGISTNRDSIVYDFSKPKLAKRIQLHLEAFNSEVNRFNNINGTQNIDDFVDYNLIKWSSTLKNKLQRGHTAVYSNLNIRSSLYRPFQRKFLYYGEPLVDRASHFSTIFPNPDFEKENCVLMCSGVASEKPFWTMIANEIPNLAFVGFGGPCQCFPFYTYTEDGTKRKENLTDSILNQLRNQYEDNSISKWNIFHYIYGMLHHPAYRDTFKDCLKRELPRIPFAPEFKPFVKAGKKLAKLHLNYEEIEPFELEWVETPQMAVDWKVKKMKLTKDKTELIYNDWLTLKGIPAETYDYILGNRSALHWIIDQYQVKTDKRSGIVSDPNLDEKPRYIVELIGKVIKVSVETVKIVKGLPDKCW
jgi:predicted helicase